MMRNARNAGMQRLAERIFLEIRKNATQMQPNGTKAIVMLSIKEQESDMLLIRQRLLSAIANMQKKSKLNIWYKRMSIVAKSLSQIFVRFVIVKVKGLKHTMLIIPSLWKSFGYVINAITIFINLLRNVCSLNDQTHRALNKRMRWPEHYGNIVRRGEISSRLERGLKSNRVITNDLWMQNLRSTGI